MNQTARVALAKTPDRAAGIRTAVELLGDVPSTFRNKHVVLKPNYNSDDPFPASTHNETVEQLIHLLRDFKVAKITVAERSGIAWPSHAVAKKKGLPELFERLGVDYVITVDLPAEEWTAFPLEGSHWKRGIEIPTLFVEADAIVVTCCLKTHAFGGHFTMSLKSAVGLPPVVSPRDGYEYMNELHGSPHIREMIAEINQCYTPDLVLIDGLKAFVRGGPAEGTVVEPGVILASRDRVAIDAVGVAILRTYDTTPEVNHGRIFDQDQIRRAVELGIGVSSVDRIELLPADDPGSRTFAENVRTILDQG